MLISTAAWVASSHQSQGLPCCASFAPTPSSDSHARPLLPSSVLRPPGVQDRLSPRALRFLGGGARGFTLCSGAQVQLDPILLPHGARGSPLYEPLPPFGPSAARCRLLCPRLTSAPRSGRLAAISVSLPRRSADLRGKTDRLRGTPAGFTTPTLNGHGLHWPWTSRSLARSSGGEGPRSNSGLS